MGVCRDMKNCSMYAGVQCTQVFNLAGSTVSPFCTIDPNESKSLRHHRLNISSLEVFRNVTFKQMIIYFHLFVCNSVDSIENRMPKNLTIDNLGHGLSQNLETGCPNEGFTDF